MTTQPLTNTNKKVVFIARNAAVVADELKHYGFPTDEGNVQPELTYTVISTYPQLLTYLDTAPDFTQPWAIVGTSHSPEDRHSIVMRMRMTFGPEVSVADALKMINNEYAINPKGRSL